jgi:hypothetical protein
MYKAESKTSQPQHQATVRQGKSVGVDSPQSEDFAQLEARAGNSPQATRQAHLAQMIDASPAAAAQRQRADTFHGDRPATTQHKPKTNNTGLPDDLKSGVENLSGVSMDAVKVHYNSPEPAQLNAHAFAQGTDIHVAPGQEQHLPHEAWHVVQQAQGRVQPTTQMQGAVPVNDNPALEHEADVMGGQAAQRKEVAQRVPPADPKAEEKNAWETATHVHGNNVLDMGHISGGILKRIKLRADYSDEKQRKRVSELAHQKLKLIDRNMYGRGKIGKVMRNIDTASRIMHLVGSLAGMVALAANIAAFFNPAALPVGAIAGVIALAAHSAMAVLQTILIGRNLYRIRGLPEAEKAKILPTLYRDMAKLGFSLLGVVTGGVGLGGAMNSGGLMASKALEGAERAAHIGHMAGDMVGDTVGVYGMGAVIGVQSEKENKMGMAGAFDDQAKPGDKHAEPEEHAQPAAAAAVKDAAPAPAKAAEVAAAPAPAQADVNDAALAAEMQADIVESTAVVTNLTSDSQDALAGADGLKADAKPLEELSAAEPKAQEAMAALGNGDDAVAKMPDMKEAEIDAKSAKVAEAENTLGVPQGADVMEEQGGELETAQKVSIGTSRTRATVQRDKKPGVFTRAKNWFKRKFSSFKKRVAKVIKSIQAKLTELVLKLAGVKNLPAEMSDGLAEQRVEAAQVINHADAGRGAIAEWKGVADKIGKQK